MEPNKIINKSIYYYNSKKYSQAIKLLEKEIFFYKNYYLYHYVLGMSYLRIGNLGNAQTYLKKAYTLNPSEPNIKQAIAILLVSQGKEEKAIQIWLKMIEENQEVDRSELSLEIIRKNPIKGSAFLKNNNLYEKLFPTIKAMPDKNLTKLIIIIIMGGIIFISMLAIYFIFYEQKTTTSANLKAEINKNLNNIAAYIDDIKINNKEKIKNEEGQFILILTSDEIKNSFEKIKIYLKKGKDNFARVEINKILNSNASESIKLKAKNLASFISRPDFISFNEHLNLKDIKKDPSIYSNVYVKWEGVVNNIEKKDNIIQFDFYVGYNKNVLSGIIPAKTTFDIDIDFKDHVEILGQIEYKKNKLTLNAITIRKIDKNAN
ncbi:tetratricopeptide repeat protein [Borreliella californiensis]|uniref:Tetratricopeptide (TPR) repeat protein n=1 Tax=Borreliella californiensis TaxID=373543 RepID=A0A7W9ZL90_9SPIR|nr:hypothetical protein [Borreliella californiensis]MBB6213230.1 tetratricopeptide (TPR) repeat protein [Borreliella californiensis]WKC91448.1 hypothetical protein QIA17_01195 [Borreliella californiensis]WNY70203.1 hypothetical protein QIA39_00660 [Borreliella californiensis]